MTLLSKNDASTSKLLYYCTFINEEGSSIMRMDINARKIKYGGS